MPHLQKLWEQYRGKGLHIYHVESQNHSPEAIRAFCKKTGMTFPQVERIPIENDFHSYELGSRVPYAYVVGVDGTVIFQGPKGYREVIHEEMKKVRYPGLGKQVVHKSLEAAAGQYVRRNFGKAIEAAVKMRKQARAEDSGNTPLLDDATLIIERAERVGTNLARSAAGAVGQREYLDAMTHYKKLAKEFKGHELGGKASGELKRLKKDKAIQKEVKALINLEKLLAKLAVVADSQLRKKKLESFAAKHDGLRAAEKALEAVRR